MVSKLLVWESWDHQSQKVSRESRNLMKKIWLKNFPTFGSDDPMTPELKALIPLVENLYEIQINAE